MSLLTALSTGSDESTTSSEYSNFTSGMPCIPVVLNQLLVVSILILPLECGLSVVLNQLSIVNYFFLPLEFLLLGTFKTTTDSNLLGFPKFHY